MRIETRKTGSRKFLEFFSEIQYFLKKILKLEIVFEKKSQIKVFLFSKLIIQKFPPQPRNGVFCIVTIFNAPTAFSFPTKKFNQTNKPVEATGGQIAGQDVVNVSQV
jgi:hypothetical protein